MNGRIWQKMIDHAERVHPEEACGLVFGNVVVEITNVSPEPEAFFVMAEREQMEAYEAFGSPTGMYHSHPSGAPQPSTTDLLGKPPNMDYFIVADGKVHEI